MQNTSEFYSSKIKNHKCCCLSRIKTIIQQQQQQQQLKTKNIIKPQQTYQKHKQHRNIKDRSTFKKKIKDEKTIFQIKKFEMRAVQINDVIYYLLRHFKKKTY